MNRRNLNHNRMNTRRATAFTLVELLVVILILAALMLIALPRYFHAVYKSRVRGCQAQIKIINTATQAFYARNHVWPTTVEEMCEETAPSVTCMARATSECDLPSI